MCLNTLGTIIGATLSVGFPPQPVYPTGLDSSYTLYLVYNTTESVLAANNPAWGEEISIKPVAAGELEIWPENGFATIEGELFYYDAVGKDSNGKINTLKRCCRNIGGRATQFNPSGTWIRGFVVAEHHNQLVTATINTETFIGENFSTDEDTLDWRIRNLTDLPLIFDDAGTPDVQFKVTTVSSSANTGTTISYTTQVNGTFGSLVVNFGDGTSTSQPNGQHTYPPNVSVDPVVIVTNGNSQVIQTPISATNVTTPVAPPTIPPFTVPVPAACSIPPFVFPSQAIPPIDIVFPPVVLPGIDLSPINFTMPSTINVLMPSLSLPSVINFGPLSIPNSISFSNINLEVPSTVTFVNVPSFGPIAFGPAPTFGPVAFGPAPSFGTINFGPMPVGFGPIGFGPVPSLAPIQLSFGNSPSFSPIQFGPAPSFVIANFGPAPALGPIGFGPAPSFGPIGFGPAPSFGPVTFGPAPSFGPVTFGPAPSFGPVTFGPAPALGPIAFGPAPSFGPVTFGPAPALGPIAFGPAPSFGPVGFGPAPSFGPIGFGPAPSFGPVTFGPAPSFGPVGFGPAPSFAEIKFGPAPTFDFIQFGPAPSFHTITFGPVPSYCCTIKFGPAPSFADIRFGPTPSFSTITFGPAPSFGRIDFGPAPSFGPVGFGPAPSFGPIGFGPAPTFGPIGFGPAPTFGPIGFGPAPSFSVNFGTAPTISVDWGSAPSLTCTCTVVCPSGAGMAYRNNNYYQNSAFGFESVAGGVGGGDSSFDSVELQYDMVGFPSQIEIAPPDIPPIEVKHDIPSFISFIMPEFSDIRIIGPEIPLPSEIRIVPPDADAIINVISFELPKSLKIEFDVSTLPTSMSLVVPDKLPVISFDTSAIPTEIKVVGMPETIRLEHNLPSVFELFAPEDLKIPLVFDGPPLKGELKVNWGFDAFGDDDEDRPCFTFVPCPRK